MNEVGSTLTVAIEQRPTSTCELQAEQRKYEMKNEANVKKMASII
jgi:hypothetical protein